ncbi:MAG: response regulator [Bacteroidota bacterium]
MEKKIILLADDDIDDTEMFFEALTIIDQDIVCHCAVNGNEAISMLNGLESLPQLIFLDLNMPILSGWECLRTLKEDQRYKTIPIFMMSTSSHQKDIDIAEKLGALCYFVKPNNFNDLIAILKEITASIDTNLTEAISNLKANGFNNIFSCAEGN